MVPRLSLPCWPPEKWGAIAANRQRTITGASTLNAPASAIIWGPDFCRNVALAALGYATTLSDLFKKAAAGTPDPGWDFEPDTVNIKKGTTLTVVDQGGEPHTLHRGGAVRWRLYTGAQCRSGDGSRACWGLFERRRGEKQNPPRQPCRDHRSVER
jgi:plastocyanin